MNAIAHRLLDRSSNAGAPQAPSRRRLAIATALAAAALALASTPAAAANAFSNISIHDSSHCLDNAKENASKLHMWSCGDGSEQQWLLIFNSQLNSSRFVNQRTGRCITAPSVAFASVYMQPCDSQALNQEWRVFYAYNDYPRGWYQIWQSASSGLCLATHSVANGTLVTTVACNVAERYERWQKE